MNLVQNLGLLARKETDALDMLRLGKDERYYIVRYYDGTKC